MALRSNPAEPGVARLKGFGGPAVVVAETGEKLEFVGTPPAGEVPSGRFLTGLQDVQRVSFRLYQKSSDILLRSDCPCGILGTTLN